MRRLPEPAWFIPGPVKLRRWRARTLDKAGRARVLHLTHADCLDGSACDVLVRMAHEGVETVWLDPADTLATLRLLEQVPGRGRPLLLSDLSLQRGQGEAAARSLRDLAEAGWRIEWRDHHAKQWEPDDPARLAQHATVEVERDGKECGATLVQKALVPDDPFARELAAVVRDHDLWLLRDPRSLRLKDAAVALGSERFVERLLAARKLDDAPLLVAAAEEEERKTRAVAEAVRGARFVAGRRAKVGVVYGEAPTNEALHALIAEHGCDAAVLFKPTGGYSLRSRKGVEVCHLVAQRFSGGGHPNASGGKLRLPAWRFPALWARGDRDPAARAVVDALVAEADRALAG